MLWEVPACEELTIVLDWGEECVTPLVAKTEVLERDEALLLTFAFAGLWNLAWCRLHCFLLIMRDRTFGH